MPYFACLDRLRAPRTFAVICGLRLLAGAAGAEAAPSSPTLGPDAPPIAEQRYQDGRRAYTEGHLEDAALAFRSALDVYPDSPKLAYNLGRCLERLGRLEEAAAAYRVYVALAPTAEDAPSVSRLADSLEAQWREARPALVVLSQPPGAQVTVGGEVLPDPTPVHTTLRPGTHLVTVRLPGHIEAAESVALVRGEAWTLRFGLQPEPPTGGDADRSGPAAEARPVRTVSRSPWYDGRATGWVLVGLSVAAAAGGTVLQMQALDARDEAGSLAPTAADREAWRNLERRYDDQQTGAYVCYGFGAALLGTGVTLLARALSSGADE
jgi:tetratricopeptide (TPR) repeat protein